LRKAFTLIELLVIIGIMGLMVTVGIVNVRSGQGAARTRGAARDVFAAVRHARSTALVTMQPAIVTYSCVMEDDEPMAKIEIHSARIMNGGNSSGKVQSLSGEPLEGVSAEPEPGREPGAGESVAGESGNGGGETLEDVLFAPISSEVVKGMRLKVEMGDELSVYEDESRRKSKISVFSNVDYLIGKFKTAKESAAGTVDEERKSVPDGEPAAAADADLQKEVSVAWETNGRTEPHQVWIYPDGASAQDGLLIKVDRFGGIKVLSGDGREDDE
jgi:hypothetical protein